MRINSSARRTREPCAAPRLLEPHPIVVVLFDSSVVLADPLHSSRATHASKTVVVRMSAALADTSRALAPPNKANFGDIRPCAHCFGHHGQCWAPRIWRSGTSTRRPGDFGDFPCGMRIRSRVLRRFWCIVYFV